MQSLQRDFFQAGLTQPQADAVMNSYWGLVDYAEAKQAQMRQTEDAEGRQVLDQHFGANAEDHLARTEAFFVEFGGAAFGETGGKEAWQKFTEARDEQGKLLRYDPSVISSFAQASRFLGIKTAEEAGRHNPVEARHKELTQKRHSPEGLSSDEYSELLGLAGRLAARRQP